MEKSREENSKASCYGRPMWSFLAVAIGGALGSMARYGVSLAVSSSTLGASRLPWATLGVNIVGSFILGVAAASALRPELLSDNARLVIATGFCGGLTTYSTFNLETMKLFEEGHLGLMAVNVGATVVVCLLAGFAGLAAGRALFVVNV